ncbi:fatty acid amide hydrolase 1 [Folsomia candida]|uniref:Fatty acid amide hydrolase 1 n=1 Tax=Folsomia candida TaxID=158441 RepID=A0A226D6J0_FOLCA|nr:fatty acid amide hydrolase 1 [Folsomia candida]OXA40478.1 Fatty acid amide hydrolase 1 [Folsomia candida]
MGISNCFQDFIAGPWISLIGAGIVCWLSFSAMTYVMGILETKKIIRKKQEDREAQFKKLESQSRYQLNEKHEKILSLSDDELIDQLQSRKLTAVEVQEAFIAKSIKVTREFNMVTEFIPQAEEWAKELDAMKGSLRGPLHGFPISVKDNCNVIGMDSTIGLGKFLYQPAEDSSAIVKSLMALGAIPFAKTNVPQTLLSFGCANPVFGLTKNFLNSSLSPGGSSGGESSLIAAGGSRLGIGSDIGGSVRIPAHFTGIAGFKVTKGRFCGTGFRGSLPNVVGIMGVPGLLADNINMIAKTTKYMTENNLQTKYDPLAVPIPWNEQMFSKKKLKIGYFTSLPYFPLVGDTEEIVLKAKSALESQGHTLVPFEMPDSFEMMNLVFDFCFGDAGEYLLKNWRHEPIPLSVVVNFMICKSPMWMRKVIVLIMGCKWMPLVHSSRAVTIIGRGANSTSKLWERLGDRKKMTEDLLTSWKAANLDLVLCPTYPFPAVPHHMPGRLQPSVFYTMIWNLFDFPAGVIKWGTESGEKVDKYDCQNDMVLRTGKQGAKQATGMPISVQIVGLPFQEELVLRGLAELEAVSPYKKK